MGQQILDTGLDARIAWDGVRRHGPSYRLRDDDGARIRRLSDGNGRGHTTESQRGEGQTAADAKPWEVNHLQRHLDQRFELIKKVPRPRAVSERFGGIGGLGPRYGRNKN
jgi:hypothetical protein